MRRGQLSAQLLLNLCNIAHSLAVAATPTLTEAHASRAKIDSPAAAHQRIITDAAINDFRRRRHLPSLSLSSFRRQCNYDPICDASPSKLPSLSR